MGGHRGLPLWRELGSGKLRVTIGSACVLMVKRAASIPRGAYVKTPNRNSLRKCVWQLRKLFG
eukprot:scaffold26677_cov59-Phaeocystis_antarctica.AAC.5